MPRFTQQQIAAKRALIRKGAFLVSDAPTPLVRSTAPRYGEPPGLDAIRQRIDALTKKIEEVAEVVRRVRS